MRVVIIGGGWSGLAAAVTLCHQGHSVHIIEAAKQLGGRARNVAWQNQTVDNGQHLMIGAYSQMLTMMKLIDADIERSFHRYPIDITINDTQHSPLHLSAKGWLPWPLSLAWNLVRSAGFSGLIQVARLQLDIPKLLNRPDVSVKNWLQQTKQSDRLVKQLWEPLCLATLNTPIDHASAHILATVLRDSLGQSKSFADLLIPRHTLGDLFPRSAAKYIEQHGGNISLQTRATEIIVQENKIQGIIVQGGETMAADHIIVATNPSQSAELLSPHMNITKPEELPICTVYLQYLSDSRLPSPMLGMTGTLSQWVFDRSEQNPGLMAVVISGPGKHEHMSKDELVQQVVKEIHRAAPSLPKKAESHLIIREKRATFACTVGIEKTRPKNQTNIFGLWLAGDFVTNCYPATLEGAIRNGEDCAKLLAISME